MDDGQCLLDPDIGFVVHGEVDRVRDEAAFVGLLVQRSCPLGQCGIGDGDPGTQRDLFEAAGVHHTFGLVEIVDHHDPGLDGQMQVPEHVALGQRRDQQLLGIPAVRVPAPHDRIRGGGQWGWPRSEDLVVARIRPVIGGRTGPHHVDPISMLGHPMSVADRDGSRTRYSDAPVGDSRSSSGPAGLGRKRARAEYGWAPASRTRCASPRIRP